MSEPNRISPLLDGFTLGNPMSDHDGIRCCPAIKENTDKKYIVKIITVPASQSQLDALLLAGAYKDPADAMEYYKSVGEEIMEEAALLKKLSKLEGFLSYDGWQMEPITRRRLGYEVYLIGSYKRSLERYVKKHPITHLEAINLGLDLCSALTLCRQAGAIYVNLKPSNIFMSEKKDYRIGDLGFVQLDAMSYTTLPDRYRSKYTPRELFDPMASINLTTDTYAAGMILYQVYNEGNLPFKDMAPEEPLPPPVHADYELAEIILKAIHPDPAQRWQDPADMGKALASYMQRNSINDDPITPYIPLEIDPNSEPLLPKPKQEEPGAAVEDTPAQEAEPMEETPEQIPAEEQPPQEEAPTEDPEAAQEAEPAEIEEDPEPATEPKDELTRIMEKADDLISHETPTGVVLPDIPEPADPFAFITEELDEIQDFDVPLEPLMDEPEEESKLEKKKSKRYASQKGRRRLQKFLSAVVTLLILAILGMGAFWYYQTMYLQTIRGISIDADQNQLLVMIDSDVDNELLHVTCSDQYGNAQTKSPSDGQVTFTNLQPNTTYNIALTIDGFHKLVGQTSDMYTTDTTTSIVSFTSSTGSTDGSVILNFTVDGEEPNDWIVHYQAEGEEVQKETFSGHTVTIDGLSIGKVYTFTLDAGKKLSLSGETTLEYMASRIVLAQDLQVTSGGNNDMTISWKAPGDILVDSWNVRCYNESGFEQQMTVTDTQVYLTDIDPTVSYTVEVTAFGMTQPARSSITANPINITALNVDDSTPGELAVTWEYAGTDPVGSWLLMYAIDGNENQVVKCDKPTALIKNQIPNAKYTITLQSADGTSIFNSTHTFTTKVPEKFAEYSYVPDNVSVKLLKTPEGSFWRYETVGNDDFTTQFAPGDGISVALSSSTSFYLPGYDLHILYVIRDTDGNILGEYLAEDKTHWKDIWLGGNSKNGELDVPKVPAEPGDYVLNIYFDGKTAAELPFTIS